MKERIDEIEKHYTSIRGFDVAAQWLFYLTALASLLNLYVGSLPPVFEFLPAIFVLLVIAHLGVSNVNSLHLLPTAEKHRRKQLLSDALGVPLTHAETQSYYNNGFEPSIERLGANLMENAHFGSNVTLKMLPPERVRVAAYALVWIFAVTNRSTDLGWILILTQVLFSGEVFLKWIKLEVLQRRIVRIYESLYSLYLNFNSEANVISQAEILDAFADYESAKAAASLYQPKGIFLELNPTLSEEWEKIKAKVGIP
jgi:hypothetical protein